MSDDEAKALAEAKAARRDARKARRAEFEQNAGRYYEAVGRLAVATASVEHMGMSVLITMHAPTEFVVNCSQEKSSSDEGKQAAQQALADARALIRRVGGNANKPSLDAVTDALVRAAEAKLPAAWAEQVATIRDELHALNEERHVFVHRVQVARDGDTNEVLLFAPSGHRLGPPPLEDMRSAADRISVLRQHLLILGMEVHGEATKYPPPPIPTRPEPPVEPVEGTE